MARSALVALLVAATSCLFVVPKDRREVARRDVTDEPPQVVGSAQPLVAAHADGTALAIQVTWKRACEIHGQARVDYRTHTGATVKMVAPCDGGNNCGAIVVFAILAAPITLAISGLVTLGIDLGSSSHTEHVTEPQPVRRVACDAPGAGFSLLVSAPGRADVATVTDAAGAARVELGDAGAARQATVRVR